MISIKSCAKLFAALILTGAITLQVSCLRPDREQAISGPVTIGDQWQEFRPTQPLKVEREQNSIQIDLAHDYVADYRADGYRFPDGSLVTIEVQLVDQDGKNYPLRVDSIGIRGIGFRSGVSGGREDLPLDKVFPLVRIRSKGQFDCSRIIWRSYNAREHM